MTNFENKSVLVLGLGETGASMLRWLSLKGARLRAADSRATPPGIEEARRFAEPEQVFCGAFSDALMDGVDVIAISPGIPLADPFVSRAAASGIPVLGDIELFAQQIHAQGGSSKVIAITGSNGKTTVTSMVEHLCKSCGMDAVAAGNISPAVLDVMIERGNRLPQVWALELSSFQLETTYSLKADAATVLNISEDHLDRYDGMEEYAAAKARIFNGCSTQVLNRDDVRSMHMRKAGNSCITFGLSLPQGESDFGIAKEDGEIWLVQGRQRLIGTSGLQVFGLHNLANAQAALALCSSIGLPMQGLLNALKNFKGLPHRVERIAVFKDVAFYDDSKGTNVGATIAALQGLGCKSVLIAGGLGKCQDFSPLKPAVDQHARAVVLIGRDRRQIESALQGCNVPVMQAKDMKEAVAIAVSHALPKDAVLLSPACASFDMFKNYAHRAEVFRQEVEMLIKEGAWLH